MEGYSNYDEDTPMIRVIFYLAYAVFSAVISIQDIRTHSIPRIALWLAIALSLFLQYLLFGKIEIYSAFAGCGIGLLLFFLAYLCSKKRLGLADIWYAGLIGSVFGPVWWYAVIILSCLSAMGYILVRKVKKIPYIPFMAGASILILPFFEGVKNL
jgi:prepilin signal peptidase PulO-like enzyme (type II secretory pathway)